MADGRRPKKVGWLVLSAFLLASLPTEGSGLLKNVRFEVSVQGVRIVGDLYGRLIPMGALDVAAARVVDLDQEPGLQSLLKLNGVGLPHYHSGWFRLRKRETALLFVRKPALAVYVPTTQGYSLLVTPEQPNEFVAALRNPGATVQSFRIAQ